MRRSPSGRRLHGLLRGGNMRNHSVPRFLGLAIVFGLVSASSALADVYGTIRGVVTDQTGAVIAGATITVTNTSTGIAKTTTTATDGSYQVVQLPAPSTYTVKAEMKGFKLFEAHTVRLSVDKVYVLNIQMEVGQLTQEISIEAVPVQVERTSIQLGATIGANQIVDMPLNGRNWVQLQQTLPGVVAASDGRGNYATNGSQTDQNNFLVNGIDTNDLPLNTPIVNPSPDAIAEIQMVTNTINPEYGRNSGAILNAVTKSGSNAFHGSGFDFFRDTGLNARNFFQPKSIVFHQHQFGGTVGGPIWRDHTFFFFSYQGVRNRVPQNGGTVTVFTQDQRNGNFGAGAFDCTIDTSKMQTPAKNCKSSPFPMVGDASSPCPAGGAACPAGTFYGNVFDVATGTKVPIPAPALFSTGAIPTADFNPISANLLQKFVPLPNSGNEYTFTPITTGKADQYISRIDHNFSDKDSIWGYWFYQINPTFDTLPFTGSTLPGFPDTAKRHVQEYVLSWNHTFGPATLNEARVGYTRFNFAAVTPVNIVDPASVGFTGINVQAPQYASWPRTTVTGFFTLGFSTNGPQPRIDQTYQFSDNLSHIVGRHTFKLGFDMRRFEVYNPFFARL